MIKVERGLKVTMLSQTGDDMLLNEVEIVAEGYHESLTFRTSMNNCPDLGAKIIVTIEEET